MFANGFKISKNFAFEFAFFHKFRNYSDGVTFFNIVFDMDLYHGDHNPKGMFALYLFNITIFEFSIYNVNHVYHEPLPKDDIWEDYDNNWSGY
jgi:hypothetical protein